MTEGRNDLGVAAEGEHPEPLNLDEMRREMDLSYIWHHKVKISIVFFIVAFSGLLFTGLPSKVEPYLDSSSCSTAGPTFTSAASDKAIWKHHLHAQVTMADHLIRAIQQAPDHSAIQHIVKCTRFTDSEGPCAATIDSASESSELQHKLPCHFEPFQPTFPQALGRRALWELSNRGQDVAAQILEVLQNLERPSAEASPCTTKPQHVHILANDSKQFIQNLDHHLDQYLRIATSTLSARGSFLEYRDALTRGLLNTQRNIMSAANSIDWYLPRWAVFIYRVDSQIHDDLEDIRSKITALNLLSDAITSMLNDLEHTVQLIAVIRREAATSSEIITVLLTAISSVNMTSPICSHADTINNSPSIHLT